MIMATQQKKGKNGMETEDEEFAWYFFKDLKHHENINSCQFEL